MVAPLALAGLSAAGNLIGGAVDTLTGLFGGSAPGAAAIGSAKAKNPLDKAKSTSEDFEKFFLESSLDRLTENSGADGPLGDNGTGGGVYRSLLVKQYAGEIVKSGGVGISGQIYNQLLKLQEAAHAGA